MTIPCLDFLNVWPCETALAITVSMSGAESESPATVGKHRESSEDSLRHIAWVKITADDTVTIMISKSEMGQGVYTSLAMIVADELEADWSKVSVEAAPVAEEYQDPVWGQQLTGGSTSTIHLYLPLRRAGAAAREMLKSAAALEWKVPVDECSAVQSQVSHVKTGRVLTYGQLCAKAARLPVPQAPLLKNESEFRLIGKPIPRIDVKDKVNGAPMFGIDVRIPGALCAVVAGPPAFGARLLSVETDSAERVPAVRHVLRTSFGIAVCADDVFAALTGRDALRLEWSQGSHPDLDTESVERILCEALQQDGLEARRTGDPEAALVTATKRVQATYSGPYLAHAYLEPQNCTAFVQEDRCDIWCATQYQTLVQQVGARITGLNLEHVHVLSTYLGGGFGGRSEVKIVEQAVEISHVLKKPVTLMWTREDDMRNDFYRPGSCCAVQGGLDAQGKLIAWSHKVVAASILERRIPEMMVSGIDPSVVEGVWDMLYAVPNLLVRQVLMKELPIPVGFWRSVGHSFNAFTKESFIDEMAVAAGQDPLAFRLQLLRDHPRAFRVVERVAKAARWGEPLPDGHGQGIAHHFSFGTHVAQIAEASVDRASGRIRVHNVFCAVDCGPVVNPDIVAQQMEGAICMGLSAALKEQVEFARGSVSSKNFTDYSLIGMSAIPDVHVDIIESTEQQGGIGEPGLPPIAPAVANAVFQASGVRMRKLPMTPERMRQALAES